MVSGVEFGYALDELEIFFVGVEERYSSQVR